LVELLVGIALAAILLTLSFTAVRHFWRVNSLEGAQGELTTQFRRMQQLAVTGDDAVVYGAVFKSGTDTWNSIRYIPDSPGDDCVLLDKHPLSGGLVGAGVAGAGITVGSVEFAAPDPGSPELSACASLTPVGSQTAFFYRRGNATGGFVKLEQASVMDRFAVVKVSPLTGHVERLSEHAAPQ
jgi:hypothetical protein